jgi:dTDP-glucose pyrophosphorylase
MHILITMAGLGSRFKAKGYAVPKYKIMVKGRSLFSWSMESLRHFFTGNHITFVVRREDDPRSFIEKELAAFGVKNATIISLDEVTDGQATTVIKALPTLRQQEANASLLIYNIDTFVEPRCLRPSDVRGDGWIPCFPGRGDAWSFFRVDSQGRVIEAKEKVRISNNASIGMYYFGSLDLFECAYHAFFGNGLPNGLRERYVAPMYQWMIDKNMELWVHSVNEDAVHPLGTPDEVDQFELEP